VKHQSTLEALETARLHLEAVEVLLTSGDPAAPQCQSSLAAAEDALRTALAQLRQAAPAGALDAALRIRTSSRNLDSLISVGTRFCLGLVQYLAVPLAGYGSDGRLRSDTGSRGPVRL
jgi:hypothetical protein